MCLSSHSDSLTIRLTLTLTPLTLIQLTHIPTLYYPDHSHSDTLTKCLAILRLIHIDSLTLRLAHTRTHSHSDPPALSLSYSGPLMPRLSRRHSQRKRSRQIGTHMGIPASSNWRSSEATRGSQITRRGDPHMCIYLPGLFPLRMSARESGHEWA